MASLLPAVPQGPVFSADKLHIARFLQTLQNEGLSRRTLQTYVGHLVRFATWLQRRYQAPLEEATTHDLQAYRAYLIDRHRPASANGAIAALQRFYRWALAERITATNTAASLKAVHSQPLAPSGFASYERQRLRRAAELAGPMPQAIITTLLNTGLRVDELVHMTWENTVMHERSGAIYVVVKGQKVREVPLNSEARAALRAIRPEGATGPVYIGKRGPYTPRGVRFLSLMPATT